MTEEKNTPAAPNPGELVDRSAVAQRIADRERGLKEENSPAPLSAVTAKSISQRKLDANRANAKKSTGPQTARGKAHSRRNAVQHGLTSAAVLFHSDGTPVDPELRQLWESLHAKFGSGNATTDALINNAVSEWAHQTEAVRLEQGFSEIATRLRHRGVGLASFHRYLTKSQRALLRTVRLLQRKIGEVPNAGRYRIAPRPIRTGGPDEPRKFRN
jgi:hypothetical protein